MTPFCLETPDTFLTYFLRNRKSKFIRSRSVFFSFFPTQRCFAEHSYTPFNYELIDNNSLLILGQVEDISNLLLLILGCQALVDNLEEVGVF